MSDPSLTPSELAELQGLLEKARALGEQGLAASIANAKPVDLGLSIGRLSRVDALQQQHMALAQRQRAELQLQQIRTALGRIASDTYGTCLNCGEPVGLARLRVRPETTLCRECQAGGSR